MKFFMTFFSIIISNLFLLSSHPISIVILIIFQSLILCLSIFMILNAGWFSLIMFLIFMGGLMVLFIYIASLASNEMFKINFKLVLTPMIMSMIIVSSTYNYLYMMNFKDQLMNFKSKIFYMYSESFFSPTMITMLYLLLTLIITVNIVKLYEAPMRSMIS